MKALWNKYLFDPGYSELNPDGVITDTEREVFSKGQCHALALEICKATGWEFVCTAYCDDYSCGHAGALMPSNHVLDIYGAHSVDEWERMWGDAITVIPLEEVITRWSSRKGGGMHPPTRFAKIFVPAVLELAKKT